MFALEHEKTFKANMSDLLINSVRDAIVPEIQHLIESAFKKHSAESLLEKFLSIDEARKMFQPVIARGTLYNWCDAGYLNSFTIGGKRFFKYSELVEAVTKVKKYSRKMEVA
jgi:hypothetical protein